MILIWDYDAIEQSVQLEDDFSAWTESTGVAAPAPSVGGDDQTRLGLEQGAIVSPRPVLGGWMG